MRRKKSAVHVLQVHRNGSPVYRAAGRLLRVRFLLAAKFTAGSIAVAGWAAGADNSLRGMAALVAGNRLPSGLSTNRGSSFHGADRRIHGRASFFGAWRFDHYKVLGSRFAGLELLDPTEPSAAAVTTGCWLY
jgi:hypothetical protein